VLIDADVYGADSRTVLARMAAARIQARPLWQPLHRSAAHAGAYASDAPVADRLNRDALSLPSSVGLTADDRQRVIDVLLRP
jgi:pyridoxal phosphate-dependent aminotransferase EpsN